MRVKDTGMPGLYLLAPDVVSDQRGSFVKVVNEDVFTAHGLERNFVEEYYSVSGPGVLRGLHLQLPPAHHTKLVYCVRGRVFDVVVDLRTKSPTYGRHLHFDLNSDTPEVLYIPKGLAHGFCTCSDSATLVYKTTSAHDKDRDSGIRWDSLDISWPVSGPLVSDRDARLPRFRDFDSPFTDELT